MTPNLVRLSPASTVPRLLCLPYAGGRGEFYRRWVPDLMGILELWTVDLPGRPGSTDHPPWTDLDGLIDALADEVEALLDRPMAIFGHSMGAMLGIEVVRRLERSGPPIGALVVSGCAAPQLWPQRAVARERSDDTLVALLRSWGGTPLELLDSREFLDIALPPLRADMHLCDQYEYQAGRIRTPILAFAGAADTAAPPGDVEAWSACANDWRGLRTLPGGHFFIRTAQRAIINGIVTAYVPRGASTMTSSASASEPVDR